MYVFMYVYPLDIKRRGYFVIEKAYPTVTESHLPKTKC